LFQYLLVLNFYADALLVLDQRRVAHIDDLKRWRSFLAVLISGIEALMGLLIA